MVAKTMKIAALKDKRIVIAGSQKTTEMGLIIEKQGGTPIVRSLQGLTMFEEDAIAEQMRQLAEAGADWIIFTTGIGAESLLTAADKLGIKSEVLAAFSQAKIATRGYKTSAFLKRTGLKAVISDDDGTMHNLIEKLEACHFEGQRVVIQLHGEPSPELERFLAAKGASHVESVLPYRHVPPVTSTLDTLIAELAEAAVDAVCFTTAVQVHYLFRYAIGTGRADLLLQAFHGPVLAAAVGKVTAEALREYGVERLVVPELERMGAMIIEISRYYEAQ